MSTGRERSRLWRFRLGDVLNVNQLMSEGEREREREGGRERGEGGGEG